MDEKSGIMRFWHSPKFQWDLVDFDIFLITAHTRMLAEQGIISSAVFEKLVDGLIKLRKQIKDGEFVFSSDDKDISVAVLRGLSEIVGEIGELTTIAKSVNDQVTTDIRLWLREEVLKILDLLIGLRAQLCDLAQRDLDIIVPGYTHMQPASPILISHWWLAQEARYSRDQARLRQFYDRMNKLPLGAFMLAGTSQPINRHRVAQLLNFDSPIDNSLDAVSDRDYIAEFASIASLSGLHLTQLANDLLIWATQEFGFIKVQKAFGFSAASIPHKRNCEMLEVLRSRPARLTSAHQEVIMVLRSVSMGFSQDLEELLPVLFTCVREWKSLLELATELLPSVQVNSERTKEAARIDTINAGIAVDFLIVNGVPPEQAKRAVDYLLHYCQERHRSLADLALNEWLQYSPAFNDEIFKLIRSEESIESRTSYGGTAHSQVASALDSVRSQIVQDKSVLPASSIPQLQKLEKLENLSSGKL